MADQSLPEDTALPLTLPKPAANDKPKDESIAEAIKKVVDEAFGEKSNFGLTALQALGFFSDSKNFFDDAAKHLQAQAESIKQIAETNKSLSESILGKDSIFAQTASAALGFFRNPFVSINDEDKAKEPSPVDILPGGLADAVSPSIAPINKENNQFDFFNKKTSKTNGIKEADFKALPAALTMGFLMLHEDITKPKKGKEKKDGGGILGKLGNLVGMAVGVAALAGALLLFAAALKVFDSVDWGSALIGAGGFVAFIAIMIGISNLMDEKQAEKFVQFGKSAIELSAALGLFAISIWLVGTVVSGGNIGPIKMPGLLSAIAGTALFIVFIAAMGAIAIIMDGNKQSFQEFGKSTMVLTGSLALFAITLLLVGKIIEGGEIFGLQIPSVGAMIGGVALFVGFVGAMALFAALVGANQGNFMQLAVGSLVLDLGLAAFAASLFIIGTIIQGGEVFGLEIPSLGSMVLGAALFVVFVAAFAAIGVAMGAALPAFGILAAGSLLLSLGLAAFAGAMWLVGTLLSVDMMVQNIQVLGIGIAVIAEAALMAAELTLAIVPLTLGMAGAALLAGFAVLVSASMLALALAAQTVKLLNGADFSPLIEALSGPAGVINAVYGGKMGLGKAVWLATITGATIIALELVPLTLAVNAAILALAAASKTVGLIKPDEFAPLYTVLNDMVGNLTGLAKKLGKNREAFATITQSLPSIANAMKLMADTVKELSELDLTPEKTQLINDNMTNCMNVLSQAVTNIVKSANKLDKDAQKAIPIIAKSLKPIAEALSMMPEAVRKTAELKLDAATSAIVFDNLNEESEVLMQMTVQVADIAQSIGRRAAKNMTIIASSLKPLIEAFTMMPDAVKKIADLHLDDDTTDRVNKTTTKLANVLNLMMGKVAAIAKILGKKGAAAFETITNNLSNLVSVYNNMPNTINIIAGLSIDELVIDKTELMADIVTKIVKPIMKLAKKFKSSVVENANSFADNFQSMAEKIVNGVSTASDKLSELNVDPAICEKLDDVSDNLVPAFEKLVKKLGKLTKKKIDTEAMNALCEAVSSSVEQFVDAANAAGAFSIDGLSLISDFLDKVARNKTFEKGAKSVAKGLNVMTDSINNLPDETKMSTYARSFIELSDALDRLTVDREYSSLTKLQHIGDTSANVKKLTSSLKDLNNTFKKLNGNQSWLSRLTDGLRDATANAFGLQQEMNARNSQIKTGAAASTNTVVAASDRYARSIYNLLEKWDANGLDVNASIDSEDKNENKSESNTAKTYENAYQI